MTDVIPRLNDALRGRYRIERELGEGGMATVYLAEDLKHDRKVAVKVLKPELAAVVGAERFLAEIKTTANLQHPHILPLFDSGEADDFLFYVMPYVEGESLREKLDRETQLRVEDALALTRKVADALDYAHGKGVVHRDIKPANILVSGRGEPLVADFGIALAVTQAGGGRITETGLSLGTPHYMSPEQATGDRDVGPRSDVYALGCVLYETLAGQPPFAAPTAQAVLVRILTEEARRVGEVRHTVPRHVSEVLARALEKLPADRFESAAEFRQALDQPDFAHVVAGAGGPAGPSPGGTNDDATRGRRGPRRAAALLPWAVSAAAVALAVWAWSGTGSTATEGVSLRTTLDLGDLEIEDDDPFFEVVISPDGSGLAVVGVVDDETNAIFWRPADDLEFRRIPGTEGYPVSPSFSPDGNWLAYVDEVRDRIMGVSLLGGRPSTIMPEGPLNPNLLDWGPGGWIVFFADTEASGDDGLYRVPDTGGAVETLFSGTTWRPLWPQLLPDDSGVLFSDPLSGSVALYDFASDTVRTLVSRGHKARYLASGHLTYLDEGGGLWAVAFDRGRGEIVGDPKPVLQGIRADGVEGRYSVSGHGTLVYGTGPVTSGGGGLDELVIVGVDGTVTPLDLPPREIGSVRWHPDGRRVVYEGSVEGVEEDDWNIWVYDVELEGAPTPLGDSGANEGPVWSPDGARVAFSSQREGTDGWDVFVLDLTNGGPPRHVVALPAGQWVTDWPEAEVLLVESGSRSGAYRLVLEGDSGSLEPYYTPEADVDDIRVSPDGTLAAYASDETGRDEVYLRSYPDLGPEIRVSEGGGFFPFWSPDGDTLYYGGAGGDTIYAAGIGRHPTAVLSRSPFMPWSHEGPDLHPDGDRFITTRPVSGSGSTTPMTGDDEIPVRHVVIHDWFGTLRRLFEGGG